MEQGMADGLRKKVFRTGHLSFFIFYAGESHACVNCAMDLRLTTLGLRPELLNLFCKHYS
jgi:hypothetical protein